MGLFSKKKKLSKEEKETLEKARKELKKIKENRDDFDVLDKITNDESENEEKNREEQRQIEDLAKLNQKQEETILASTGKTYEDYNQTGMCCTLDCDVPESVLNGKECKFCNRFCCIDHLLCHKHDCVKDRHVKFVRKLWLRKYGLNVSTGYYTVACDACGYASTSPSLIEIAGEERISHIVETGCSSNQVWLEGVE
ncbi:hypothetical protein YTPLAS73_11410 [Nitrosarchaeum sp.]|nr:hypothetical protein YTPLAS73_11410 [Nitrosarchaeum sp.]